jgi:hypothetical protein
VSFLFEIQAKTVSQIDDEVENGALIETLDIPFPSLLDEIQMTLPDLFQSLVGDLASISPPECHLCDGTTKHIHEIGQI